MGPFLFILRSFLYIAYSVLAPYACPDYNIGKTKTIFLKAKNSFKKSTLDAVFWYQIILSIILSMSQLPLTKWGSLTSA